MARASFAIQAICDDIRLHPASDGDGRPPARVARLWRRIGIAMSGQPRVLPTDDLIGMAGMAGERPLFEEDAPNAETGVS